MSQETIIHDFVFIFSGLVYNMDGIDNDQTGTSSGIDNSQYDATEKMIPLEQRGQTISIDVQDSVRNIKVNKQIDFILAFVDNGNLNHGHRREEFEAGLRDQGLELEYEQNGSINFVKIHAPLVIFK